MNKPKVICISGTMRSGKDTFFELLYNVGQQANTKINFFGLSFATELKNDLVPIIAPMGIDVVSPTNEQKEIIRPIMIAYGCAWRAIDPQHWVKKVDSIIDKLKFETIPVIRDVRFISEAHYYFEKYGRENVCLIEIIRHGAPTPPAEELKNQPFLSKEADVVIQWETDPTLETLKPKVQEFFNQYIQNS